MLPLQNDIIFAAEISVLPLQNDIIFAVEISVTFSRPHTPN